MIHLRPRPKDLAGSCACSPFDAIIARIEALEQRAAAIVSSVEGIPPDGTGNVNLPNSSEIGDTLYGRMDAFTMSSVAKAINDELNTLLTRIGAFDFAGTDGRITAATEAIEQIEAELESYEARITAVEEDIISINAHILAVENDYVQKVGDTMTGPLRIPTNTTGTRNDVAVNGNRLQADLDAYQFMVRTVNDQVIQGKKTFLITPTIQCTLWVIGPSTTDTLAVIKLFNNASAARYVHFTAIRTAGGFEGRVMFSISSSGIVEQTAVSKMGTVEPPVCGLIQLADDWYIYISGGGVGIKDVYVRQGSRRNINTDILDEPIQIGETETKYEVVWS